MIGAKERRMNHAASVDIVAFGRGFKAAAFSTR